MEKLNIKNKGCFQILILSFISVVSISLQLDLPKEIEINTQTIYEVISNLTLSIQLDVIQGSILLIGLFAIYSYAKKLETPNTGLLLVLAAVISCFWAFSVSYLQEGSLQLIYKTKGQLVKSVIYISGFTILNYNLLLLFYHKIHSNENISVCSGFLSQRTFIRYLIIILVIWLPTLIISYPAKIYGDTWNQIGQAAGTVIKSTHHPAFVTVIISLFLKIGFALGNVEYGLFLLEVIQMLLSAMTLAYSLTVMQEKFNAPKWILIFSIVIFSITAYSESFSVIVKDVPYSLAFLILVIELCLLITDIKSFFKSKTDIALLCVAVFVIGLFRNNGKYLILVFSVFLFIYLIKKEMKRYILYLIIPLIFAVGIDSATAKIGGYIDGSKIEIFCLPIQQVARIVAYHPESVSDEQKEVLSKVCDYEKLSQSYAPLIADSAKETFIKSNEINQDIKDFLKVWLQLVKEHPVTAISATINQNIPLVYPFIENSKIYDGTSVYYYYYDMLMYKPVTEAIGLDDESHFENVRTVQMSLYELINKLPILGLFSQQAIYVLLLLSLMAFSVVDREIKEFWLVAVLELLAIGMIIVGPCIQYMPRYAYPIVYSTPVVICYYYSLFSQYGNDNSTIKNE